MVEEGDYDILETERAPLAASSGDPDWPARQGRRKEIPFQTVPMGFAAIQRAGMTSGVVTGQIHG